MTQRRHIFVSLIVVFALLLMTQSAFSAAAQPKKVGITFKSSTPTLQVGHSMNAAAITIITPSVKVVYDSNNSKVATVSPQGMVKGIAKGQAVITVTVSQNGYTGKGSFTLQVADNPVVKAGPITYSDLQLLDKDVRAGIQALYKQNYTQLSAAQTAVQQKLLNIDRKQLLDALYAVTLKAEPSWSVSYVQDFAVNNLENDISAIAGRFAKASDEAGQRAVINMLSGFKSPKALEKLGLVLNSSSDANLRYSLCYLLSKFPKDQGAFDALATLLSKEQDSLVISNATSSILLVADTDAVKIKQILSSYGTFSPDAKKSLHAMLVSYDAQANFHHIYLAWKDILLSVQKSGTAEEKSSADAIWAEVGQYSPYKD